MSPCEPPPSLQIRSHAGCVRGHNEDRVDWRRVPGFAAACVLCDGVGGFRHGAEAARSAATSFLDALFVDDALHDPGPQRLELLLRRRISRLQQLRGDRRIATTLTGLLLSEGRARLYHVGDSRAFRLRGGTLELLTEDHNVPGGGKHLLQRALGHPEREELDRIELPLEPGDRFLLCSDGLERAGLDAGAILDCEARSGSLAALADDLLALALAGGAPDNVSLALIDGEVWR